jgi:hypothetical protein
MAANARTAAALNDIVMAFPLIVLEGSFSSSIDSFQ